MKLSFYATALLGVMGLHEAQSILLESHDIDFADYELAELHSLGSGEVDAAADADCMETVNGVTLRLTTPECSLEKPAVEEKKPEASVENQMLKALGDLSGKSTELQDALKLQFAKTKSLMSTTNVTVSGSIKLTPAGPAPESPAPKAAAAPCSADAAVAPK